MQRCIVYHRGIVGKLRHGHVFQCAALSDGKINYLEDAIEKLNNLLVASERHPLSLQIDLSLGRNVQEAVDIVLENSMREKWYYDNIHRDIYKQIETCEGIRLRSFLTDACFNTTRNNTDEFLEFNEAVRHFNTLL
jgi:hypothetical protein